MANHSKKIGVIGLGTIGSRIAQNLQAKGFEVFVWSRTPRSEPNFLTGPEEVVDRTDIIQLFVGNDVAVLESVKRIAPRLKKHHTVIVHSTISPESAREAGKIVNDAGAQFLESPFTGSKVAAQNAQLVYYVAGQSDALESVRTVLEASSKKIVYIGAQIGHAAVVKITTNMMTGGIGQLLSEILAINRAAGVDLERFREAFENNGCRSGTSDMKMPLMMKGDYSPHFSVENMLKDSRLALGLGESLSVSLPATDSVEKRLSECARNGWEKLDFSVLFRLYDSK